MINFFRPVFLTASMTPLSSQESMKVRLIGFCSGKTSCRPWIRRPLILNLIERFWKFLKRKVARNRSYATFAEFRTAVQTILNNIAASGDELASLLTKRFQLFTASSDKPIPLTLGRRYPRQRRW
jgi:hypothetical protein